jgi:hypothetical protein
MARFSVRYSQMKENYFRWMESRLTAWNLGTKFRAGASRRWLWPEQVATDDFDKEYVKLLARDLDTFQKEGLRAYPKKSKVR